MSIKVVSVWLNVHHSTKVHLRERFQQIGRAANRPQWRHPRVTTPAQDCYVRPVHLRDRFQPTTQTAEETVGVSNRRIVAQAALNRPPEAELHVQRPHPGHDLTDVRCWNHLAWANTHFLWSLTRWTNVMFTNESRFNVFHADRRHRV